jgi:hypothetical protein
MAGKNLEVRLNVIYKNKNKHIKEIDKLEGEVEEYQNLSRMFLTNLFNEDDFKQYLRDKYGEDLNIDVIVDNIINSVEVQIIERIKPIPKISDIIYGV